MEDNSNEYQFTDRDFKDLMVPIHKLPDQTDPLKYFDKLKRLKSFRKKIQSINKLKIIKYIIYLYDQNSPFNKHIIEPTERMFAAAEYSGFKVDKDKDLSEELKEMFLGKNELVNKMIVDYLRIHKTSKWALVKANEKMFYDELSRILKGEKESSIGINNLDRKLQTSIEELTNRNNNILLQEEVMDSIAQEALQLTPEIIANRLEKGEAPITEDEIQ